MKKENNETDCGSCLFSGLKLAAFIVIILAIWFVWSGCRTGKEGCVNPKHVERFNNSRFNK